MSDIQEAGERWVQAQRQLNETERKAMVAAGQVAAAMTGFNEVIEDMLRADVERYGLEEALSRYLGTAGNEVDAEFLAKVADWERIVGAKVTLLPRWKFRVEKTENAQTAVEPADREYDSVQIKDKNDHFLTD